MDHGLGSEWAHLRGHRRPSSGHDPPAAARGIVGRRVGKRELAGLPLRGPGIQLGYRDQRAACLADCSPTARQSLALPRHNRDNLW